MNVAELREALGKFPDDQEVRLADFNEAYAAPAACEVVRHEEGAVVLDVREETQKETA